MRIRRLRIFAADAPALRVFYGESLGLPVTAAADELAVEVGETTLIIEQEPIGRSCRYHFAINIPENRIASAKEWLASRVELVHDRSGADEFHFESWGADAVYFRDPAGNILELIARHELSNAAAGPFGKDQFLSISEIGLATQNTLGLVDEFGEKLDITPYRPPSPTFAAVGNADGLLVIVPEGRPWFPDNTQAADPVPLIVDLTNSAGHNFRLEGPPYQVSAVD